MIAFSCANLKRTYVMLTKLLIALFTDILCFCTSGWDEGVAQVSYQMKPQLLAVLSNWKMDIQDTEECIFTAA